MTISSRASFAETKNYVVGNPLEQATTMGPMAQARFADFIREQKAEALRKGATAHINMKVANDVAGSPYLAPEVLTNVDHQMSVMREESFGPIVGIMKVRNDEEAIALMNDSPYGLTASIWTSDTDHAVAIGDRVETGTVFMNRCDYLDPALVWTGVKDTGKGAALSALGYDNLTRPKSYHLREAIEVISGAFSRTATPSNIGIFSMTKAVSKWNYPTTVRFGAGRIKELPDALAFAGIKRPLFVTDPGLAKLPVVASTLKILADAKIPHGVFSDVKPIRSIPTSPPASPPSRRASMTASSPSAAARRSTSAS